MQLDGELLVRELAIKEMKEKKRKDYMFAYKYDNQ